MNENPVKVKTTKGTIEHFGLEQCEQQASIVLKILQKYGYANFKRITLSTWRLGDTREERERNIQAFKRYIEKEGFKSKKYSRILSR